MNLKYIYTFGFKLILLSHSLLTSSFRTSVGLDLLGSVPLNSSGHARLGKEEGILHLRISDS